MTRLLLYMYTFFLMVFSKMLAIRDICYTEQYHIDFEEGVIERTIIVFVDWSLQL